MRFDDRITFVKKTGERYYDTDISDWVYPPAERDVVACHVSDLGLERSMQVFGNYTKERRVVRLEREYKGDYESVEYNAEPYHVVAKRLDGTVLYIERDSI